MSVPMDTPLQPTQSPSGWLEAASRAGNTAAPTTPMAHTVPTSPTAPTAPTVPPSHSAPTTTRPPAPDERRAAQGLRRRLLALLMMPLGLLALISVAIDYRAAGTIAQQYDEQLRRHLPLLANSVVAPGASAGEPPLLLLAPAVAEFLKDRGNFAGFRVSSTSGALLHGELWIPPINPSTPEPELHSVAQNGVTYRIAAQRVQTGAGELVVQLADGSDPRQQWLRSVLYKVLLPNLVVVIAAFLVIHWAVRRALAPLHRLKEELEQRSPRDLSSLSFDQAPEEVRPFINALNRLFGLVNAQTESQRRFVADAAHQLRTPLAGLQSQVEAWAEQAARAQAAQSAIPSNHEAEAAPGAITLQAQELYKLRSATRRTSQLANQLLALSRADAQAMHSQPMQLVDLKALCEETLATHLDAAIAKRIDLGLDAAPARVQGHEWLLRELLSNLTDNAIKYTPRGGAVTIRCGVQEGADERAFVEVEDDGPGIPEADRQHVTQRFYRVQGTPGEGNGLGLAIASEIAHLHQAQWLLTAARTTPEAPGRPGLRVGLVFGAQPENWPERG